MDKIERRVGGGEGFGEIMTGFAHENLCESSNNAH